MGAEGEKQLIAIKEGGEKGVLSLVFEKDGGKAIGEVLGAGGLPPLPGNRVKWALDSSEGYPSKYGTFGTRERLSEWEANCFTRYPCRTFR